jgi:hypothetical protein
MQITKTPTFFKVKEDHDGWWKRLSKNTERTWRGAAVTKRIEGGEEEKETQMRDQGIGIFAICMYTCIEFGHILKKLPPLTSSTRQARTW